MSKIIFYILLEFIFFNIEEIFIGYKIPLFESSVIIYKLS